MASIVPLAQTSSQTVSVMLGDQQCQITVLCAMTGVFLTLEADGVPIVNAAIVRDRVPIVRNAYRGFAGDLWFIDQQGTADPNWSGFGGRWVLVYGVAA